MNNRDDRYDPADLARRWASEYAKQGIVPRREGMGDYPDGPEPLAWLKERVGPTARVTEFGCGYGRLAHLFDPVLYRGVDTSETAIERGHAFAPDYDLAVTGLLDPLPLADVVFAYTVLNHIPAQAIPATVVRLASAAPRVLVIERTSDGVLRGDPYLPDFQRPPEWYAEQFAAIGYRAAPPAAIRYKAVGHITGMEFTRC